MKAGVWKQVIETGVWTQMFEPRYLNPGVWTQVFEHRCLNTGVWTQVFETRCLKPHWRWCWAYNFVVETKSLYEYWYWYYENNVLVVAMLWTRFLLSLILVAWYFVDITWNIVARKSGFFDIFIGIVQNFFHIIQKVNNSTHAFK